MNFSGGNGGAVSAHVYASGVGGNGPLTVDLGGINAVSESQEAYPDGLEILFRHGKLLAINKLAHNLWENFVVRQFGFHEQKLVVEKSTTFTYHRKAWSESDFAAAADNALATAASHY